MVVKADLRRMLVVVVMSILRICFGVCLHGGMEDNHNRNSAVC
jgi:hypothetical protein